MAGSDTAKQDALLTNLNCRICCMSKPVAFPARRKDEDKKLQTKAFGDMLLADYIVVLKAESASFASPKYEDTIVEV